MAKPRCYLRLFGGVALEIDGAPAEGGRATQRRRLAILALLAASPTRQLSRDKLVGYLWPESETDAARHLLTGAIYELRKALGEKSIVSRGEDLALSPALVDSDLARMEAALEAGDRPRAIALYAGPFADGFFVSEAPDFEHWIEETRARYQRHFRELLEAEAGAREKAGALVEAAELWVKLATLDPSDGRVALRTMQSLHAAGQTAAAIRHGQAHANHLRREFGTKPDAAVTSFGEQLRRTPNPAASRPDGQPAMGAHRPEQLAVLPSGRRAMIAGFIGGALVLGLVAVIGLGGRSNHPADAILPPRRVVILPFAVPDTQQMQLRAHLTTLLGTGLDGAGDIEVVRTGSREPDLSVGPDVDQAAAQRLAARAGAGGYILSQVEETSGALRLRAWLYTMGHDEPLVQAEVSGDQARVAETVDRLVKELLSGWPRPPADRLSGVAARSARSVAALKAWLEGEHEFRAGRYLAASDAFARAIERDTLFALAYYRLSQARLAADFPETSAIPLDQKALALSEQLPERDRLLIRAYVHFRKGEAESAEQRYQSLVNLYPDDLDAWVELGETRFHYNPLRGLPVAGARAAFERAAELDPNNWTVQWHLAHLEAIEGDREAFVRIVDRLLAMEPENAQKLDLRYLRALALGDRAGEARLTEEIANADELRLFQLIWRAAVYLRDLDGAERIARVLAEPSRPHYPQMLGRMSLVYLAVARGDREGAEAQLKAASIIPGVQEQVLLVRVYAGIAMYAASEPALLRAIRDSVLVHARRSGPDYVATYLSALGMLESALGDTALALSRAEHLQRLRDQVPALVIRADVAYRRGRPQEALDFLNRREGWSWYGYQIGAPLSISPYTRHLQAAVLEELGRGDEARGWRRSLEEFAVADLVYTSGN